VPIRGVVSTCLVHLSKFGLEQANFLLLSFALGNEFVDHMLLLIYVHLPVEVFAPQTDLQVFSFLRERIHLPFYSIKVLMFLVQFITLCVNLPIQCIVFFIFFLQLNLQ
jgi:hypothetical protein